MLARRRLMTELALSAFDQRVGLIPLVTMRVVERWFGTKRGAAVTDVVVEPEGRDGPGGPVPCLGLAIVFGSIAKCFDEPARAAVEQPVGERVTHLVVVLLELIDGGLDAFAFGADLVGIPELSPQPGPFRADLGQRTLVHLERGHEEGSLAGVSVADSSQMAGRRVKRGEPLRVLFVLGSEFSLLGVERVELRQRPGRQCAEDDSVAADLFAQLDETAQARDRLVRLRTFGGDLLCRGAARGAVGHERRVVLAARGRDLVDGEVLVVPDQHPTATLGQDIRPARRWACFSGRDLDPLGAPAIQVGNQQARLSPCPGERAVAPPGGQILGRCDHERALDGSALHPMTGQAVGVLNVIGDVSRG